MPEEVSQPGENFKKVERPFGKMLLNNFLGGIAWGLGVLIGTTLVFAIIALVVRQVDFVPILGNFLADVIKASQNHFPTK